MLFGASCHRLGGRAAAANLRLKECLELKAISKEELRLIND